MPDLSRSCWRKIVCKNIEGVKGRLSCGFQPACPLTLLPQEGCCPHAVCHSALLLLTSQLRILFHRIWNSTSPRRALPSFWRAEGQGESSQQMVWCKGKDIRSQTPGVRKAWPHFACSLLPRNFNFPSLLQIRACKAAETVHHLNQLLSHPWELLPRSSRKHFHCGVLGGKLGWPAAEEDASTPG